MYKEYPRFVHIGLGYHWFKAKQEFGDNYGLVSNQCVVCGKEIDVVNSGGLVNPPCLPRDY